MYLFRLKHTQLTSVNDNYKATCFGCTTASISGVPRNFSRGGVSTISVEDRGQRERGSGGGSPLVRGSGGSCNLVQEISFHMVMFLVLYTYVTSCLGEKNNTTVGGHSWPGGLFT